MIGILKNILRKVHGKPCLDYEEMCTVLCDGELSLNAHSLAYVSDDPTDLKPLTSFLHTIKETEALDIDILNKIDLNASLERK